MKVKEIKFENDVYGFIKRCVFNSIEYNAEYKKALYNMIHKSSDIEEFIDNYLGCNDFSRRQAYAVLSERCRPQNHWYKIREALGEKCFKTVSDVGGVKVGNESFSFIVSNGQGDGVTRCAIFKKGEWNNAFLNFETSIQGEDINVYAYDCGTEIAEKLEAGRYGIYRGYGFVVFEKWD